MSANEQFRPADLNTPAMIYRRVVTGTDPKGGKVYHYTLLRQVLLCERRQRSSTNTDAHQQAAEYQSYLGANWWDVRDLKKDDLIVYGEQDLQVTLDGIPINVGQRNRWGILKIKACTECLYSQGVDSCHCCDEDRAPKGSDGNPDCDE